MSEPFQIGISNLHILEIFGTEDKKSEKNNQKVKLYTQNYYTKTTKERLNAILHLHTNGKVRIVQVRGKWLVRDLNTDTEINFYDGMVVFQKPLTLSDLPESDTQLEFSIV